MKNIKLIIKTVIWVSIISVALFFYLQIGATYNTMEVGFYGLPENTVSVITKWLDNRNIDWKPVIFDSSKPLEDQLKAPVQQNLLFTTDGKNMDTIASYVRTAKTNNLMLMPIPIRISVQTGSRLTATPILLDHFQLSYNIEALRNTGYSLPTNFVDFETIAQDLVLGQQGVSSIAPILCAGGNDDDLLMFFTSMIETLHGIDNYEIVQAFLDQLVQEQKGKEIQSTSYFNSFFELPQVEETLEYILLWEQRRFLSSSWLSLSRDDIARAMENETAFFTFMPFSVYETLSQRVKTVYAPWYMPSGGTRDSRYLVAPSVVVMEFSYVKSPFQSARQAGKKNELAASLIEELVSGFVQTELSEESSLVPVNASALIDEMGAGETRQMFSLSDGIIADIGTNTFTRLSDKAIFAQALRDAIQRMESEF